MDERSMTMIGPEDVDLFFLAMGIDLEFESSSISILYRPAFTLPFISTLDLGIRRSMTLRIPIDQWYTKEYLDRFENFWKKTTLLTQTDSEFVDAIFKDIDWTSLNDYNDINSRDGFHSFFRGCIDGHSIHFMTTNPEVEFALTHCKILSVFQHLLVKHFPMIHTIQLMRNYEI